MLKTGNKMDRDNICHIKPYTTETFCDEIVSLPKENENK